MIDRSPRFAFKIALGLLLVSVSAAEATAQTIPRLVRYGGVIRTADGQPRTGLATLTFAIFAGPQDDRVLWAEVQNVQLDEQGRYSVLLGSTRPGGLSPELFDSDGERWLAVRVDGEPEQLRVPLVSVPYALRSATADNLGGLPLSSFVLVGDSSGRRSDGLTYLNTNALGPLQPLADTGAATEYWSRSGTELTQATAGDTVKIYRNGVSGTNYEMVSLNSGSESLTQSGSGNRIGFGNNTGRYGAVGGYANGTYPGLGLWAPTGPAGVLPAAPSVLVTNLGLEVWGGGGAKRLGQLWYRRSNGDDNVYLGLGTTQTVTNTSNDTYMVTISPTGPYLTGTGNPADIGQTGNSNPIGFNIGQWRILATDTETRTRQVANVEMDFITLKQSAGPVTFNDVVNNRFRFSVPDTGVTIVDDKGIDFVMPGAFALGNVTNYKAINIPTLSGSHGTNYYGIFFDGTPASGSIASAPSKDILIAPGIGGRLRLSGVAEYEDNGAARAAGLSFGAFYRTGDALKIVHDSTVGTLADFRIGTASLRDNAGQLEYRNFGGLWTPIGVAAGTDYWLRDAGVIAPATGGDVLKISKDGADGQLYEMASFVGNTMNRTKTGSGLTIGFKTNGGYFGAVGGYGNGSDGGMGLWANTGSGAPQVFLRKSGLTVNTNFTANGNVSLASAPGGKTVGNIRYRTLNGDDNVLMVLGTGTAITDTTNGTYMVTVSPLSANNTGDAEAIGFNIGNWTLTATDTATRTKQFANTEMDYIVLRQAGGAVTFEDVVNTRFRFVVPKDGVTVVDSKGIDFLMPPSTISGSVTNYKAVNIPSLSGHNGTNFYGMYFNNNPANGSIASEPSTDISIRPGSGGYLQYGVPLIGTGGGVSPAFANGIGGAGQPTTATQAGWMMLKDASGAIVWVPVWK